MAALDFPDQPTVGQLYGSSGTVWRWDGARWASTAGASGARGLVGYAATATNVSGLGAGWSNTGVAVTFTVVAGRAYRVSYSAGLDSNHGGFQLGYVGLYTSGGSQLSAAGGRLEANGTAGETQYWNGQWIASPGTLTPGPITFQLRVFFQSGAGNAMLADNASPAQLTVEDITYEAGSGGPVIDAAKLPKGHLANGGTSAITNIAADPSWTPIAGLTLNFTAVAGRLYRFMYWGHLVSSVAGDILRVGFFDGASNLNLMQVHQTAPAGSPTGVHLHALVGGMAAGPHTVEFRAQRVGGSGGCQHFADGILVAQTIVEDVGA